MFTFIATLLHDITFGHPLITVTLFAGLSIFLGRVMIDYFQFAAYFLALYLVAGSALADVLAKLHPFFNGKPVFTLLIFLITCMLVSYLTYERHIKLPWALVELNNYSRPSAMTLFSSLSISSLLEYLGYEYEGAAFGGVYVMALLIVAPILQWWLGCDINEHDRFFGITYN